MADIDAIAPAVQRDDEQPKTERTRQRTLGNVRLRNHETSEIILIPSPSKDLNDPLNWPQWYKHGIAFIICLAMMWCNFLAAGPTIAIVRTTLDFFPHADPTTNVSAFNSSIAKVAYFFTATALLQGTSNFFWVPMANKYGRRPVYIISYVFYLACAIWLVFEKSFAGFLAARILLGVASGAAETIAPITIADIYFLHERGTIMALYTASLTVGVSFGIIIAGLITIDHHWRVIYQVAAAIVGFMLFLLFFCFPETAYMRDTTNLLDESSEISNSSKPDMSEKSQVLDSDVEEALELIQRRSYWQSLRVFHGVMTEESICKMAIRPLGLICLPPVLWAALVQSVTIGFLVVVTTDVDTAFETGYGFQPYQVGLCFIAAIIGSVLGIPAGGRFGDLVADWLTKRNGGVREPEMRLPAILLSQFTTPLALILFGIGIHHQLHWICPTIGLALLNFSITQGTNVCLVYVIDAYRPVTGEITLAVMGFKSIFGFLLSFYTYPWISHSGYDHAFGTMAGISFAIILFWVPLYFWGKRIRHNTWNWPVVSFVHWTDDREVGE